MTQTEKRVRRLLQLVRGGTLTVSGAEQRLEERGLVRALELFREELEIMGEDYT